MNQKCFHALAILHSHKDLVDKLLQVAIVSDFVDNIRLDEIILEPFQALVFTKAYSETPFSKNSYHAETSRVDLRCKSLD